MDDIADKKELRKRILKIRNALPPEERAVKSAAITNRLTELQDIRQAATIMVFLNFGSEVQTDDLISWGWEKGKRIVAPLCCPETREMAPCVINDFSDLETGHYGIREPKAACSLVVPPEEIDVVLIPAVAFDRQGRRVGYGGGYYDRFLPKVPRAARIGMVFSCQIVPAVNADAYDIPAQKIVTEKGVIVSVMDVS
ncbi:MAG: 5-formyltetrahydrofolate cyclo-ligase [Syntrophales bacterium]|jgi:5-formyltetrahydrofolate cyclo-ligase|nr:5-formyltetrahydrofolate cyclo-ligase [Syntrophales bacterium]